MCWQAQLRKWFEWYVASTMCHNDNVNQYAQGGMRFMSICQCCVYCDCSRVHWVVAAAHNMSDVQRSLTAIGGYERAQSTVSSTLFTNADYGHVMGSGHMSACVMSINDQAGRLCSTGASFCQWTSGLLYCLVATSCTNHYQQWTVYVHLQNHASYNVVWCSSH